MRKQIAVFCVWALALSATAQIPDGYYNTATGTGAALKTQLYNIIKGHTQKSYDYLWTSFRTTDKKPNGKVWDIYSDIPGGTPPYEYDFGTDQCGSYSGENSCYNREHSFPKSWFNDASPMYSDMFHLYPTDGYVNGRRSNYAYGEVASPTWTSRNGSKLGPCSYPGYTGVVFEPIDAYKGDLARTYFYMATRYENLIASWHSNDNDAEAVLQANSYPVFEPWFLEMLIKWHKADPVSQKEIDRNNAIYGFQNNRNPYIDHPEWVYSVWGGTSVLPEPTNHVLSFAAGAATTASLTLTWNNNDGAQPAENFLILVNTTGTFSAPADGTPRANDLDLSDNAGCVNVLHSQQTYIWQSLAAGTTYYFAIYPYTNSGADINYKTDGTVPTASKATSTAATPSITVEPVTLSGFSYAQGNGPSAAKPFTVSGSNLTADITLTAPADFEISKSENSGYATPLVITGSGGTVSATTVYARLKAALQPGNYTGENISVTTTGANARTVACSGTVTYNDPSNYPAGFSAAAVSPATSAIDATWTDATGAIVPEGYVIKAAAGSYSSITAPADGTPETPGPLTKIVLPGVQVAHFTGLSAGTQYYFRIYPFSGSGSGINYKTTATVPEATATTTAIGSPSVSASPAALSVFSYVHGSGPSAPQPFTVQGSNLTQNIAVSAPSDFEISLAAASGYTSALSLTQSSGSVNPTSVYVRLRAGLSAGSYNNETVTVASTDAASVTVACSGTVTVAEPPNHAAGFTAFAVAPETSSVDAVWTDAAGVPEGYLVRAAEGAYSNIQSPADGTQENNELMQKVVPAGSQLAHFTGLKQGTVYYFRIFPFNGSGENTNYKTDNPPQDTARTIVPASAANVIFSEYIDGADNNKVIEITNLEITPVDLSRLAVRIYSNGSTAPSGLWTGGSGQISAGESYVIYNPEASDTIAAIGNENSEAVYFNGNDALQLLCDAQVTDVIGVAGTNPGAGWAVAGTAGATAGHTLVRKPETRQGNTDWAASAGSSAASSGWLVKGFNNLYNLGAFGTAWQGTAGTVWASASNWDLGIPTASINAIIPAVKNIPEISGPANANNLLVHPGAMLRGQEKLTLAGHANILHSVAARTGGGKGWSLLSSPVAAQPVDPVFTDIPANYDFYRWNEPASAWQSQKITANRITSFITGESYLAGYAYAATRIFSGPLIQSDVVMNNLSHQNTGGPGWHMLGNPFLAPLQWNEGHWALNNILPVAKIWMADAGSYTDIAGGTGVIPVMSGFVVESTGQGSLTIPLAAGMAKSGTSVNAAERIRLVVKDLSTGTWQECVIKANGSATTAFDAQYDSHFLQGNAPGFYVDIAPEALSTATYHDLNGDLSIALGFKKNAGSSYSIELAENSIPGCNALFLTDKTAGTITDLIKTPQLLFTSAEPGNSSRFVLNFKDVTASATASASKGINMFTQGKTLCISNSQPGEGNILIFSAAGQLVAERRLSAASLQQIDLQGLPAGVYIVKAFTPKSAARGKIILPQ